MSKEDFEDFGDFDNPEMFNAAKMGDVSQVKELLEQWKSKLSPAPLTALHLHSTLVEAVSYHHSSIASYLLDEGAEITENMLVLALGEADMAIAMFQTFLDHGWDINSKTGLGAPVLKYLLFITKFSWATSTYDSQARYRRRGIDTVVSRARCRSQFLWQTWFQHPRCCSREFHVRSLRPPAQIWREPRVQRCFAFCCRRTAREARTSGDDDTST